MSRVDISLCWCWYTELCFSDLEAFYTLTAQAQESAQGAKQGSKFNLVQGHLYKLGCLEAERNPVNLNWNDINLF